MVLTNTSSLVEHIRDFPKTFKIPVEKFNGDNTSRPQAAKIVHRQCFKMKHKQQGASQMHKCCNVHCPPVYKPSCRI